MNDHRDVGDLVAIERDLELIEAIEVKPVARDLRRPDPNVLDRRVDAADRAAQLAGPAVADRTRDLQVDHAGLILAAEGDQALTDLEVARRDQRERDIDAIDLERLQHAAVLRLFLLRSGAAGPDVRRRAGRRAAERGGRRGGGI